MLFVYCFREGAFSAKLLQTVGGKFNKQENLATNSFDFTKHTLSVFDGVYLQGVSAIRDLDVSLELICSNFKHKRLLIRIQNM